LRLGVAGGGTDVSPYSDEFGVVVLNATINRYAFAFIEPSPDGHIHFIASDRNPMSASTGREGAEGRQRSRPMRWKSNMRCCGRTSGSGEPSIRPMAMLKASS